MNIASIALVAVAMSLSACSKSSKSKKSDKDPNKGKITAKAFSEKYQFELNGCNTGKHEFGSDSQADVKSQLCDALQNEELNKFCAQPLRKGHFDRKCSGIAWSPVYPQPSNPSRPSNPSTPVRPDRDYAKESEIREALEFVLVDSFEINEGLSPDIETFATNLSDDMRSCGFSYVGPKCLNYHAFAGSYEGTLIDPNGESIFLTDLMFDGINSPILFAFKIKDDNGISSEEVGIYVELRERINDQPIAEYLESADVQKIASLRIAPDFVTTASDRLASPRDLKELYHMGSALLELSRNQGNYSTTQEAVLSAVTANKSVISSSEESDYQMRMMSMVDGQLGANSDEIADIASSLLDSAAESVKQMGATYVLLNDTSKLELKDMVRDAARGHSYWTVRERAIQGLNIAQRNLEDENLIISKLNDNSQSVREAAASAASGFSLSNSHLPILHEIQNSSYWTSRETASALIGKIDSPDANRSLINKMSDNSQSVREEVVRQLSSKSLTEEDLRTLETQLNSSYWTVRVDAVKLVGKIQGSNSANILISKMSDNSQSVREEIYDQLSSRDLNASQLGPLSSQFSSSYWTVRENVATLLGRIGSQESNIILINNMSDNSQSVREEIERQLGNAVLNDSYVDSLKSQFSSSYWTVREDVARLLGTIKTDKSLDALVEQLQVETSQSVKTQIAASIAIIRG